MAFFRNKTRLIKLMNIKVCIISNDYLSTTISTILAFRVNLKNNSKAKANREKLSRL